MEKWIETKRHHLKVLIRYLDKDYSHVKKRCVFPRLPRVLQDYHLLPNSLYPLLENGLITFDLLWALWKPNTLAYTTTYGTPDEARVFKVEMADKHYSIMKGDFYYIEGKVSIKRAHCLPPCRDKANMWSSTSSTTGRRSGTVQWPRK